MRGSLLLFVAILVGCRAAEAADFARDVQPILARHCYECHGAEVQKNNLRLDERASAMRVLSPGNALESELYRRITLPKGHEDIMPSRGEPLSRAETDRIRDWINNGAEWPDDFVAAKHWAYVPPARPVLPEISESFNASNEIDHFIFARLKKEGLRPSPEADRAILLRRVYLDLIGLPPSPADVEAFLADNDPGAYEKVVERLLSSPQYGVRWARPWLDLARYADSSGYQRDNLWEIWPYRDWVINALNQDMPFDQFTIEQIAGDLLPNPTLEQKVATGFNRCVPTNVEAGADQEETRVNQIFDRVNTMGAVWLGSTLECAQCHNHKYDPISQKEYYQLFAFFNNTPQETDLRTPNSTVVLKFTGPYLSLPDSEVEARRDGIQRKISTVNRKIENYRNHLADSREQWESELRSRAANAGRIHLFDIAAFDSESDSFHKILEDKSVLLIANDNDAIPVRDTYTVTVKTSLSGITGFKLEVLTAPSLPGGGPGRGNEERPNFILNEFKVTHSSPKFAKPARIKLHKPKASFAQRNFPAAAAIDNDPRTGWGIAPEFFKDHWVVFQTVEPLDLSDGSTLTFRLEQNNGAARTIGRFRISAFTGKVDDAIPSDIIGIINLPEDQRSARQRKQLEEYRLANDASLKRLRAERSQLQNELKKIRLPRTLVMQELPEARMTSLFVRGNFLEKGETVQPGTPSVLHPLPDGPLNRLTLAKWLVDTNNPLVARVTVNRWWAEFFGQGLVTTPEDFGIKGDLPTHPELLDWLAVEFMSPTRAGVRPWSMKHIHRLIVTSATYRQSSVMTPELLERDDKNKLYARGPRFRMDAEMIRDNALAVSGLLSLKLGGPSIRPYQPPGLWESKVGGESVAYEISPGEDRYRRGIYVVWKRTSPYPSFINFDATGRNACVVKRSRSNTPLQALTLLNDPVYVEAAAGLAKRVLNEKPQGTVAERIRHAFILCLARSPKASEAAVLERLYREQLESARQDIESARRTVGEFIPDAQMDVPEFSAWHAVAWALLNLNETITKG